MIAHLVGGPAHGEDLAVGDNPQRIIEIPKLEEFPVLPYCAVDLKPVAGPLETHSYRLLHTDGRYAIYQWAAPNVEATFEVEISPPRADRIDLLDKLRELTGRPGETPQVTSVYFNGRTVRVAGRAIVDGPPDAHAAKKAAAQVQSLVDCELRGFQITATTVDVHG